MTDDERRADDTITEPSDDPDDRASDERGTMTDKRTVYIDATYGYIGSGPIHDLTVRIADHRWIAATDYGDGANMTRSGVWIPQRSGGWWTAPTLDRALRDCPDPVIYRTRKAARESIT